MKMEINVKLYAAIAASVLAAGVSWKVLDLPRPALDTEVEVVANYGKDTRSLFLRSDRRDLQRRLDKLLRRQKKEPNNQGLDSQIRQKREDIRDISEKIENIKRDK